MSDFACDRDLALHLEEHYKRSGMTQYGSLFHCQVAYGDQCLSLNDLNCFADTTPDLSSDQLLARAVEQQEKHNRRLQEQKEFDMLRVKHCQW